MTAGIYTVNARLKIALPPAQTKDIQNGVREYLNSMLLRHNKLFDGIILGYSNERILDRAAPVSPYFTYVNLTVQAQLTVFRPKKGLLLPGLVNKIGSDFIGLLVLGTFNCAIPQALIRREFQPRELEQTWVSRKDPRHVISVGSSVAFEVRELVLGADHVSLVGALDSPKTGLLEKVPPLPADTPKKKAPASAADRSQGGQGAGEKTPEKKRKAPAAGDLEEGKGAAGLEGPKANGAGAAEGEKAAKKKKKKDKEEKKEKKKKHD